MAETKQKKGFNAALYAVVAGIVVAVALVLITIFAFTTRYTGFSNEKVAQAYVDTIVQTGDGYNAYKNTLVSKNQKFGKFVTNAYMLPYINEDAKKASFVGTGTDEEIEIALLLSAGLGEQSAPKQFDGDSTAHDTAV